jgi:hypothetical protein
MNQRHKDPGIDALIGKTVQATYWDGHIIEGVLYDRKGAENRFGYMFGQEPYLIHTSNGYYCFYKTHIKSITETKGEGDNGRIR